MYDYETTAIAARKDHKMNNGVFADYKIFAGNGNPALAEEIAGIMGRTPGKAEVTTFADGEQYELVREKG